MKIWRSYGSGHSASLAVVGKFQSDEQAELFYKAVEDFVNGAWEERYADVKAYLKVWKERIPGIDGLGPRQEEFDMGLNDSCEVSKQGTRVEVSGITSPEIGGIIKIMLLGYPARVQVTGRTGP
jgi:hypothetical protein